MASVISRREIFKQLINKRSLQLLGVLLPGGLERIFGLGNVDTYGSPEEAGVALGRRIRNGPTKLIRNASSTKNDESKVVKSEESVPEQGNNS